MRNISTAAAIGLAAAFVANAATAGTVLDAVKARGSLICGVGTGTAGFMMADSQGTVSYTHLTLPTILRV